MAQTMISHQQSMEMDLDLDTIGLEMVEILGKLKKNKDDQLDPNFIQDDNDNKKKSKKKVRRVSKEKKYSTTKVKARDFLKNISYRRCKPKNFKNEILVIDIYSFLLQNLNPLMTDRVFDNENDR